MLHISMYKTIHRDMYVGIVSRPHEMSQDQYARNNVLYDVATVITTKLIAHEETLNNLSKSTREWFAFGNEVI